MSRTPVRAAHILHMRERPGMYIGACNSEGIEHLAGEIIANSIDQFLAHKASRVSVILRGPTITVSDDGPGFQSATSKRSLAEQYLSHFHCTPTADGHAPHIHLTPSGLGLSVVNALSSKFFLRSQDARRIMEITFSRGEKLARRSFPAKTGKTGTAITFIPDPDIFGAHRARRSVLRSMLFHAAHLFPGLRVHFGAERFYAPGGLGDFTALFGGEKGPSFHASVKAGPCLIHASATGWGRETPPYVSWVNGMPTAEHGSHVDGFRAALRKARWMPSFAAIHIIMCEPRFAAPTKGKLHNDEVVPAVCEALLPFIREAVQHRKN